MFLTKEQGCDRSLVSDNDAVENLFCFEQMVERPLPLFQFLRGVISAKKIITRLNFSLCKKEMEDLIWIYCQIYFLAIDPHSEIWVLLISWSIIEQMPWYLSLLSLTAEDSFYKSAIFILNNILKIDFFSFFSGFQITCVCGRPGMWFCFECQ